MAYTKEERCRIWLSKADMASRRMAKLLEIYGSAQSVWECFAPDMEKALGTLTYRTLKEYHDESLLDRIVGAMEEKGVIALYPDSEQYSLLLKGIDCPPAHPVCSRRPCHIKRQDHCAGGYQDTQPVWAGHGFFPWEGAWPKRRGSGKRFCKRH